MDIFISSYCHNMDKEAMHKAWRVCTDFESNEDYRVSYPIRIKKLWGDTFREASLSKINTSECTSSKQAQSKQDYTK